MSSEHSNDAVTEEDRLIARRTLQLASLQFFSLRCPDEDPNGLPDSLLGILLRGRNDNSDIERWRTWNDTTALLAYSSPRDRYLEQTGLLDFLATLSRVSAFGLTEWAEDSVPAVSLTIDDGIEVPDTDGGVREQLKPVLAAWTKATEGKGKGKSNAATDFQPPAGQFNRSDFLDALKGVWVSTNAAKICARPVIDIDLTEEQLHAVAAGGSIPTLQEMRLSL